MSPAIKKNQRMFMCSIISHMIGKSFKIIGDGTRHSFAEAISPALPAGGLCQAKWVLAVSGSGNASDALVGGPEVSSLVGFPIPKGLASVFLPAISEPSSRYDLKQEFYFLAVGDVLNGMYGVD